MSDLKYINDYESMCSVPMVELHRIGGLHDSYPELNIKWDVLNASSHKITCVDLPASKLLLPVDETVLKRISCTFFESGFRAALDEACSDSTKEERPIICKLANGVLQVLNCYDYLKLKLFPHLKPLSPEVLANFTETRDWMNSFVRYIDWHPQYFKYAIAGSDDIIRIYTDKAHVNSIIKCSSQKNITCIAWRPFYPGEIAVCCEEGVYMWTVERSTHITRSSPHKELLAHPDKQPILSLQWNKNGQLMATISLRDRSILLWQPDSLKMLPLRRYGPSNTIIKWSPQNEWLFSSTVGRIFHVWDCENYLKPERWNLEKGSTVQAACWSPCSTFMMFVIKGKPLLYRLQFALGNVFKSESAKRVLAVADLTACCVDNTNVGGMPQQLAWDPNGQYLVVSFKDTNAVVVFHTNINFAELQITPAFYIKGNTPTEFPNFVCFQSINRKNSRIVLTIAWSSGRLHHYPLA